jgi:hypothetical protein
MSLPHVLIFLDIAQRAKYANIFFRGVGYLAGVGGLSSVSAEKYDIKFSDLSQYIILAGTFFIYS